MDRERWIERERDTGNREVDRGREGHWEERGGERERWIEREAGKKETGMIGQ